MTDSLRTIPQRPETRRAHWLACALQENHRPAEHNEWHRCLGALPLMPIPARLVQSAIAAVAAVRGGRGVVLPGEHEVIRLEAARALDSDALDSEFESAAIWPPNHFVQSKHAEMAEMGGGHVTLCTIGPDR